MVCGIILDKTHAYKYVNKNVNKMCKQSHVVECCFQVDNPTRVSVQLRWDGDLHVYSESGSY